MSCEPDGVACLLVPSWSCCSRGTWLTGASCRACLSRLIVPLMSWGGGVHSRLVVASRLVVSGSGEASASRLIPGGSEWGAVLVLPSRIDACLPWCRRRMGRCRSHHRRSRLFPIILWLRGMDSVRCPSFGSSSPASCPRCYVSSMDVYNEYDVCDVYKRYKDTKIQKYDEYMGRCGWDDSDAICYAG